MSFGWTGQNASWSRASPGKLSGITVLRHSSVQAQAVLESYELRQTVEEIAFSYDLDPASVYTVIRFATR